MSVVFFAVIAIKKPYAGSFMLSLMAKSLLINANRLILYNMKGKQMRHYYSHAARLTCHFLLFLVGCFILTVCLPPRADLH